MGKKEPGKRRVVLAIVIPLLLIVGYVSSWLTISKAAHVGLISGRTSERIRPVFNPIFLYLQSDLLGARELHALWWQLNPIGVETHYMLTGQTHFTYVVSNAMNLAPVDKNGSIVPEFPDPPLGTVPSLRYAVPAPTKPSQF